MEKLEGLPVAPFMDREKVTKSSSQIGFIKFALLPLFEALRELFPVIEVSSDFFYASKVGVGRGWAFCFCPVFV